MNTTYRLYVKFPNDKRFKPVDWQAGRQVTNLIYTSLFTVDEVAIVTKDLNLPENKDLQFEFRPVNTGVKFEPVIPY